ncbi:MAG: TetR/AcrR family transcriptional regulator [Chloroflexi bacterium]|nr:MAG: TetR/AcrR family transcriptional regulator [Chloroflexota bacterium]
MARSGRRPGRTGTRDRILVSARAAFGESGFEGATVRGIARAAGVDPALVHHYFGSKEQLFVASIELPFDPQHLAALLVRGGLDGLGERMMRFAVSIWGQPRSLQVLLGIARSATSDPRAAEALRGILESSLLPAIRELGVDQPELRASLIWSQVVGLVFGRFVVGVTPLTAAAPEQLVAAVAPILQLTLTAPMP